MSEVCDSFDDLKLSDELLKGIYASGFKKPSGILKRSIIPCVQGGDTIVQAQSGTDKTATFCIAALNKVDIKILYCQVLILVPTEEVAKQTFKVFSDLGKYMKVQSYVCLESTAMKDDLQNLQKGVQVIVGTPARVIAMIDRDAFGTNYSRMFVLDEADVIFSKGLSNVIRNVMKDVPHDAQKCVFSATLSEEVQTFTTRCMLNPVKILEKEEERTLDAVRQLYSLLEEEEWKFDTLCDIGETLMVSQVIIYTNTNEKTKLLQGKLSQKGYTASCMHGEMEPSDRELVLKKFKQGSTRMLVIMADLARGIDVQMATLFINYDLPTKENYIYMIGRTGRFGTECIAVTFVMSSQMRELKDLQTHYKTKIEEMPMDIEELVT